MREQLNFDIVLPCLKFFVAIPINIIMWFTGHGILRLTPCSEAFPDLWPQSKLVTLFALSNLWMVRGKLKGVPEVARLKSGISPKRGEKHSKQRRKQDYLCVSPRQFNNLKQDGLPCTWAGLFSASLTNRDNPMTIKRIPLQVTRNLRFGFSLAFLSLIIFVVAFSWASWQSDKQDEADQLSLLAELGGKSINSYFAHFQSNLSVLNQEILDADGTLNLERVRLLLTRFRESNSEIANVNIANLSG